MNQIWMREHNRVTDFFIKINGHWNDERLFQETRRVVIAEMQHVVYNEFVPLLIGMLADEVFQLLIVWFYCTKEMCNIQKKIPRICATSYR